MRELKATDKITQKMTRDGAVSENLATGEVEHISSREPETELSASSEESAGAAAEMCIRDSQEIVRRTTSGCKYQQHRQDRPGIAFLFRFRRFRLGGLRSFLFRTNTFTKVLYADRASGIDRTGLALLRTGADNRCFRLFSILRECHEVGFIHLVQKMHGLDVYKRQHNPISFLKFYFSAAGMFPRIGNPPAFSRSGKFFGYSG